MLVVSQDGSGDYFTIQEAIDNAKRGQIIFLKAGIYKEKVVLEKSYINLIGEDVKNTIITYDDYAKKILPDGQKMGTFRSYTILVGGNHINIENLTIENSSGDGELVGQAIAAYVDGDFVHFKNCHLLGHQDTLFTGPLPPKPKIPGSFVGPRENKPYKKSHQYYEKCYISGDIDFIFGSAIAIFEECDIYSHNRGKEINGFITAASTPEHEHFGYIFIKCRLISDIDNPSVYLGRPWREFAKVRFIKCYMGKHIIPKGWDYWDDFNNTKTIQFYEEMNYGEGSIPSERPSWVIVNS